MLRISLVITISALSLTPLCSGATGLFECQKTDRADWLTKVALSEMLETEGWSIRRIKEDGGCWEVYGTTPEGKRVEGYFHPVTGEAKLISQRGRILFQAD